MRYTQIVLALMLAVVFVGCSRKESQPPPEPPAAKSAAVPPPAHGASPAARARTTPPTPPYHRSAAAARPLPRTLPPEYFRRSPLVARAYQIAGEIPTVIAQQPCYCRCDRLGHRSLLDCYASDHGAG
ncbi:MAG: hypothetical protein IH916_00665 [Acidobacteria bacterium]|nr:hypothetical protein [Acidobacteriota bacterium]